MRNWAHVGKMLLIAALVVVGGLARQRYQRPADYGRYGAYRAGALQDIFAQQPRHQGMAVCNGCHDDIVALHDKDVHFGVACEDCHGPAQLHVQFFSGEGGDAITEASATLPREYTLEGCLFCHRKLAARPRNFPQVDPAEHFAFLHVKDATTRCIECHSPHEPLFLLTKVTDARIHPVIFECESCHNTKPAGDYHAVATHPVIFECRDCHPKIVADFATHEHAFMRCTACHLFYQENENAGRIFKNGNQRFCLLCHEQKPFKQSGEGWPQIVPSDHPAGVELDKSDTEVCLGCHLENIHGGEALRQLRQ